MPSSAAVVSVALCFVTACAVAEQNLLAPQECTVGARVEGGCICGLERWAEAGHTYISFRGVPFAQQPLGELRFKELRRVEPWGGLWNATVEGPVCPQTDVIYGRLASLSNPMDEACIYANIHVPRAALPPPPTECMGQRQRAEKQTQLLPILVMIHGGGFMSGSGGADLHGPEYLVSKNLIVITFNYRLNVFGFLSLNSTEIPGNQGLRDQVTLLRWVQRNARSFGGDPRQVTIMGQSAGAANAHLLALSEATKGLFKRAFLMSGTAISSFFSTSPVFSAMVSQMLMQNLGINATDPAEIHRQLVELPWERLRDANAVILDQFGLLTFSPTVESAFPGVTRVLDDFPEALVAAGRGSDIPLIIGFTSNECQTFRPRLEQIDLVDRIAKNPLLNVPLNTLYSTPPERIPGISEKIMERYYDGAVTLQGFFDFCSEAYYEYPALRLAELRARGGGAPAWVYRFGHESSASPVAAHLRRPYRGAAHIEDLTYVFRTNSMLGAHHSLPPTNKDDRMKDWMTNFVYDYMHCGRPVCHDDDDDDGMPLWPTVTPEQLQFQDITQPKFESRGLTEQLKDVLSFYDNL